MVIKQLIDDIEEKLDRTEAFLILEHVLNISKAEILMTLEKNVDDDDIALIDRILKRRLTNEPLQYITHKQYFYGNRFYINENVLIPRADTEILVEEVLKMVKPNDKVLDLCTGSGCIAVALKKAKPNIHILASDISRNALIIAMLNAKINDADISFVRSNLFENICQKFDVIVSNPPYIKTEDIKSLQEEVKHEPSLALDGGKDGMEFYKKIIINGNRFLNNNGLIALEIGYNQAKEVSELLLENNYKNLRIIKDYGNNDRVVLAYKGDK